MTIRDVVDLVRYRYVARDGVEGCEMCEAMFEAKTTPAAVRIEMPEVDDQIPMDSLDSLVKRALAYIYICNYIYSHRRI